MTNAPVSCDNRLCKIAIDGRCVEGIEPAQSCPHFGRTPLGPDADADDDDAPEEVVREIIEADVESIELPEAEILDRVGASRIRYALPSRVVAIIGGYDSGKTSIVAGLFDLFQLGPVGQMKFAGSSTLAALELACHDARVASGRTEPHSPRTPRGAAEFFHLDIQRPARAGLVSILISNRAGEEYEEVAGDVALAGGLFEIGFSNTITILVDGDRLVSSQDRHNAISEPGAILQGLLDGGALDGAQQLAVVLTKLDAVHRSPQAQRAAADFERVVAKLARDFSKSFSNIRGFKTAASPKGPEAQRGEGLAHLLSYWIADPIVPAVEPRSAQAARTFALLRGLGK